MADWGAPTGGTADWNSAAAVYDWDSVPAADDWNPAPAADEGGGEAKKSISDSIWQAEATLGNDGFGEATAGKNDDTKATGESFSCGLQGHDKANCPNPKIERPSTGEPRVRTSSGHRAVDCTPKRELKFDDEVEALDWDAEKAWDMMQEAEHKKDSSAFRLAFFCYARALSKMDPENGVDLVDLEKGLRSNKWLGQIVAIEPLEIPKDMTIVDFQGNPDKTYIVDAVIRGGEAKFETQSAKEKLERLKDCGMLQPREVILCSKSGELDPPDKHSKSEDQNPRKVMRCAICNDEGHQVLDCKVKAPPERPSTRPHRTCRKCGSMSHLMADCDGPRFDPNVVCRNCEARGHSSLYCEIPRRVTCLNCNEAGHVSRECKKPRKVKPVSGKEAGHISRECDKPRQVNYVNGNEAGNVSREFDKPRQIVCLNCNEAGHMSRECAKPRQIICRNCDEAGHISRECDKPRKIICRNCDEAGHISKECPKPRDYSRVTCNNCGQKGHTVVRCKEPPKDSGDGGWGTTGVSSSGAPGGGWDAPPAASGGDWDTPATTSGADWDAPAASSGADWDASAAASGGDWATPTTTTGVDWDAPAGNDYGW